MADGGVCEQELLPFLELVCTLFLKEIPLSKLRTSELRKPFALGTLQISYAPHSLTLAQCS